MRRLRTPLLVQEFLLGRKAGCESDAACLRGGEGMLSGTAGRVALESPARRFVIVWKLLNIHGWHIFAVKEL